jgi:hypothetical protein
MAYLLDANVFIAAKNLHYGFDFCPAFWDWILEKNEAGIVLSIETVSAWASGRGYESSAVSTFLQVADYYLVAQALAERHIVVTHEVPSASTR